MKNLFKYTLLLIGCLTLSQAQGMERLPRNIKRTLGAIGLYKSPQKRLIEGMQKADYEAMDKAIKDGANVNVYNALSDAIAYGDVNMATLLLNNGANPNNVVSTGGIAFSPLFFALTPGYSEQTKIALVKLLLSYNADIKMCNPGLILMFVDSTTIGRMLIQAGIDLNLLKQVIDTLEKDGSKIEKRLADNGYIMNAKTNCAALKRAYELEVINPNKKRLTAVAKIAYKQYRTSNVIKDILQKIAENNPDLVIK